MQRWIATGLGLALFGAFVATSCAGKQKPPVVPAGHHMCSYCCTTANIDCSCVLVDAVACPDPNDTARLSACAECRACTRAIEPGGQCDLP